MKLTFELHTNTYHTEIRPRVDMFRDGILIGRVMKFDGTPTLYLYSNGKDLQCITLAETEEINDQWEKACDMVKEEKRKEIMKSFMEKGVALGQWGWIDREDGNKHYCLMCGAPPMEPMWENCLDRGIKLSDCDKKCHACHGTKSMGYVLELI